MARDLSPEQRAHYARIQSLTGTQAWDDLAADLRAADERTWKRLVADMKAGKTPTEAEIAEIRGAHVAIETILKQPEKAARILARHDEKEPDAD